MTQNRINEEITYEQSMVRVNSTHNQGGNINEKNRSCCIIIPFGKFDFHEKSDAIDNCRESNRGWNFDEIIIEEEDYKWLIEKSNKLKILATLENEENGRNK